MKMMGEGTPTDEEAARPGRGVLPKEQKKFSRSTVEAARPDPVDASADPGTTSPSPAAETERPPFTSAISLPADHLNIERKRRSKDTSNKPPGLTMAIQFLVFAALVGSFFVGRATVPNAAPAPRTAAGNPVVMKDGQSPDGKSLGILSDELLAKVDDEAAVEFSGDPRRAFELLQSVKDGGGRIVGLDYHLALLAYASGDLPKVLPLLNLSISEGEEVAACYNLRGTMTNRRGGIDHGIPELEMASKLDPFDARYAFFLGEALRRGGKPLAALTALRKALYRLREPMSDSFYRLKIRLTQVELGQEADFADEMKAELTQIPPAADWVLTAAAVELHRGNIPAAKGYFDQAKSLLPERELLIRLRDYYFFSFAHEKELAPYFVSIMPAIPTGTSLAAPTNFNPTETPTGLGTPFAPVLNAPARVALPKAP